VITSPFGLIVSVATVGYPLAFVAASNSARGGSVTGRAAAFAVGLIALPPLALLAFFATIAVALRCDESCNENLPGWRYSFNAWQWQGEWIVTVAALLLAIAAVVLLAIRKERPASLAAALTTVCVAICFAIAAS
jgi:cytochrome bd-type quinol oxidase subunit 2